MTGSLDAKSVLRALVPYPAVFVPNQFGGYDVYFSNFPSAQTSGLNFNSAHDAAEEELTTQIYLAFKEGAELPPPSDPATLPEDDEEIAGTRVLMIEPDRDWIMRRLGLVKKPERVAPDGQRYRP